MKLLKAATRCLLVGLLIPAGAHATDLLQVYQQALISSPVLKQDKATENVTLEGVPISWATLLPQLQATAGFAVERASSSASSPQTYNQRVYTAQLTQTLFNLNSFATVHGAYNSADSARKTYDFNVQSFIVSVAQAYFNVLQAKDNVQFTLSKEEFAKRTYIQTKEKYDVGLDTITDLKQAESTYYAAVAERIQAENTLADNREDLTVFTGRPERNLAGLKADFPFTLPMPDDMSQWVKQAVKYNRQLAAARYTADASYDTVMANVGNQLPTLNVTATDTETQYSANVPAAVTTTPSQNNLAVSLNLSWTIFAGGALWGNTLQAAYNYAFSSEQAALTYRQVVSQTRQDYMSVVADVAQVEAFRQSVKANELSLEQFKARYNVGVETIIGVLNRLQELYQAKQQLAQAEYQYIIDVLNLEQDAGMLTEGNLTRINRWLQTGAAPAS